MKITHSALFAFAAAFLFVPASAHATALSDLTAATGTNNINNAALQQEWDWNSLAGGNGLLLSGNGTTAANNQTLLNVIVQGANSTANISTLAGSFANVHSGTNSTNYGVHGLAGSGTHLIGVKGETQSSTSAGDAGVFGLATGTGAIYGVYGSTNSATGYGGYFENTNGGYAAAFMGGNVGIGTATPINLLDIGTSGGIHIASGVPVGTSMALYNNSGTLTWNGIALATGSSVSGTTNYIPVYTGASSLGNSVIYQNGSNVGIGTATPQSLIHAYGGEVQVGSSGASCATANNGAIRFSGSTLYYCTGTTWTSVGGGSSQWTTSGSNIYYSTGNVGIGTSASAQTLQVHPGTDQTLQVAGHASAASGTTIRSIKDDYSVWEPLELIASTTVLGVAGNVGVNTTSPSYTLQVNGSVAGTSAYVNTSDARYKKNVKPLQSGLNEIAQLKPVTFEWKDEALHPENVLTSAKSGAGAVKSRPRTMDSSMQGQQIGFVAQDVEKILPSVVVTEDNAEKTKGMKYSELIPVLVKAMQEQQAQLAKDEATIAAMKSKLGM